jgi:hypothetical protein
MPNWCGWLESNQRPLASEANTLSTELQPHWQAYCIFYDTSEHTLSTVEHNDRDLEKSHGNNQSIQRQMEMSGS